MGTIYCDTHQLLHLTLSHMWHFTKRTMFSKWRNWDTRQLNCSSGHIMKSSKRQGRPGCSPAGPTGSPLPTQPWASRVPWALPCLQNCSRNTVVTVTSSGQRGQSLRLPWAETLLQNPDTQRMGWRRPGCCPSCSGGIAGEIALHYWQRGKKSQASTTSKLTRNSWKPKEASAAGDLKHGKCWSCLTTQASAAEIPPFCNRLVQNCPWGSFGEEKVWIWAHGNLILQISKEIIGFKHGWFQWHFTGNTALFSWNPWGFIND